MDSENPVLLEIDGEIAVVTLNRPAARNAMSRAFTARFNEVFAEIGERPEIKVAVLTGNGPAFCAGVDLKELASGTASMQPADQEIGAGHRRFGMAAFAGPVIGAINGPAMTGGLELALNCDIRIASTAARFADTHARVGVIPGGRMSSLLPRLIGLSRAKEMSLGAAIIDAATAERWGLVNRVVEPEQLMPAAMALAREIAMADRDILIAYNRLIDENFGMDYAAAVDNEHVRSRDANQAFRRERVDVQALTSRR
jgi:enoyl-CoA hydratase